MRERYAVQQVTLKDVKREQSATIVSPSVAHECHIFAVAGSIAKAVWRIQGDKVVAHLLSGAAFGELALMQVCI